MFARKKSKDRARLYGDIFRDKASFSSCDGKEGDDPHSDAVDNNGMAVNYSPDSQSTTRIQDVTLAEIEHDSRPPTECFSLISSAVENVLAHKNVGSNRHFLFEPRGLAVKWGRVRYPRHLDRYLELWVRGDASEKRGLATLNTETHCDRTNLEIMQLGQVSKSMICSTYQDQCGNPRKTQKNLISRTDTKLFPSLE
jgi:hypothetical protein